MKSNNKKKKFILVSALMLLIISLNLLYSFNMFSMNDNMDTIQCITSENPIKDSIADMQLSNIPQYTNGDKIDEIRTSGLNESDISFTFNYHKSRSYDKYLSFPLIGELGFGFGIDLSFLLNLPVEVKLSAPDSIKSSEGTDNIKASIHEIYNNAYWEFETDLNFYLFCDILGFSYDGSWDILISENGYFTTPLHRIVLPFNLYEYEFIDIPGIGNAKITVTPVLVPYITADIETEGPCITTVDKLRWDAYNIEKKIPIQTYAYANGSEDISVILTNFHYNIDIEFEWSCVLEFYDSTIQYLIDILNFNTRFPLFSWPRIPLGHLYSNDEISRLITIIPPVYQTVTINVRTADNTSIAQHPNDWAVLIIRKQPYVGEYYFMIISDSKTQIRVPDGEYAWDFYIDGLTMCSGTSLNSKIINVVPGLTNYTIFLNPFFTNVTFHDLVISVFDNSSSIWEPISTNETGYVLCLDSWYLDHPYTGVDAWQVVGADPAVAGDFNMYVSLDEDGLTEYIHFLRPLSHYKASVRYQGYTSADYFDSAVFNLNSTNSGRAILYGSSGQKSSLIFDNIEPEINRNGFQVSGDLKKIGDVYYTYGKINMQFAPTDNFGVHEVIVNINDNYYQAAKNTSDITRFSLEIDALEFEDGIPLFEIIVKDYAGNIYFYNATGDLVIDTKKPEIKNILVINNPDGTIEVNATIEENFIEQVEFYYNNGSQQRLLLSEIGDSQFYGVTGNPVVEGYQWYLNASDLVGHITYYDNFKPMFTRLNYTLNYDEATIFWDGYDIGIGIISSSAIYIENEFILLTDEYYFYLVGNIGEVYLVTIAIVDLCGNTETKSILIDFKYDTELPESNDNNSIPGYGINPLLIFLLIGTGIISLKIHKKEH